MSNTDLPLVATDDATAANTVVADDFIKSRIFTIRGVQVMLDRDLADLYGVETRVLNQAVKRNAKRFPANFMFQLSAEETEALQSGLLSFDASHSRSQFVTLNGGRGSNIKYLPYGFTEQGVAMLSAVLRSATAIEVSVRIMNVFVAMRKAIASIAPMLARIDTVERRQITDQVRNEERFDAIFKAMDGGDFPSQKVFFNGKHYDAYSSLKDLGRQYCAVTKMDAMFIPSIMQRI